MPLCAAFPSSRGSFSSRLCLPIDSPRRVCRDPPPPQTTLSDRLGLGASQWTGTALSLRRPYFGRRKYCCQSVIQSCIKGHNHTRMGGKLCPGRKMADGVGLFDLLTSL